MTLHLPIQSQFLNIVSKIAVSKITLSVTKRWLQVIFILNKSGWKINCVDDVGLKGALMDCFNPKDNSSFYKVLLVKRYNKCILVKKTIFKNSKGLGCLSRFFSSDSTHLWRLPCICLKLCDYVMMFVTISSKLEWLKVTVIMNTLKRILEFFNEKFVF